MSIVEDGQIYERTFTDVRERIRRLLAGDRAEPVLVATMRTEAFCLGCGKPTSNDCGCPAGTGWRTITIMEPTAVPQVGNSWFDKFAPDWSVNVRWAPRTRELCELAYEAGKLAAAPQGKETD